MPGPAYVFSTRPLGLHSSKEAILLLFISFAYYTGYCGTAHV